MRRLDPAECAVIVVDVQERLAAAMPPAQLEEVTRAATILIEAARLLGARVLATEQYPQGLGPTIAPIAARLAEAGAPTVTKVAFSACDEPAFQRALSAGGAMPRAAIVLGMETHVCVFQTARELASRGIMVHVPIDGVASRREDHRATGLSLCRDAGATITTAETIAFDWLRRAGSDAFRTISKLIR
jgi:nicotinamidase-related amidase